MANFLGKLRRNTSQHVDAQLACGSAGSPRRSALREVRAQGRDSDHPPDGDARSILDCIPGLIAILTSAGDVEYVNRELRAYLGVTVKSFRSWLESGVIHAADLQRTQAALAESLATGKTDAVEFRLRRFDGEHRWLQCSGLCTRGEDGSSHRWYLLMKELQRGTPWGKRTESLLAAGERLSSTGSFVWLVAREKIIASEQLHAIFELEPSSTVSMDQLEARVHVEDLPRWRESLRRARDAGSDFEHELRLKLPNGDLKHVLWLARAARDTGGELEYVGAVHDVTERRQAQVSLDKARSELARLARAMSLGLLTASIAHEISQPLSGVVINANTCLRMLASEPANLSGARETARRTIQDGLRAAKIAKELRALFSQKEAATESVDLNEATRDLIALASSALHDRRVELQQELATDLPLVSGDRVQIQQVVLNLVGNGADAMSTVDDRPRQLLIRTERDAGGLVRLSVRDSGVGFDPIDAGRLFDPFYTTKQSGMGIGLSVSRSIIEGLGGRLWATLNDGPGATFAFLLQPWRASV